MTNFGNPAKPIAGLVVARVFVGFVESRIGSVIVAPRLGIRAMGRGCQSVSLAGYSYQ